MVGNEYRQSIIKLMKASALEQINLLDYQLIKNAEEEDIYNLDDPEGLEKELEAIAPKKTKKKEEAPKPPISPEWSMEKETEERMSAPTEDPEVLKLRELLSPHMPQKPVAKPITTTTQTVSPGSLDSAYMAVTKNWGKHETISRKDVERIIEDLLSDVSINNAYGDDKDIVLREYTLWLNDRYLDLVAKNADNAKAEVDTKVSPEEADSAKSVILTPEVADGIKTRLSAALVDYRKNIINKGFGFVNGATNRDQFFKMLDQYFAVTTLRIILAQEAQAAGKPAERGKRLLQNPSAFFKQLSESKENIDMFNRVFFLPTKETNKGAAEVANQNKGLNDAKNAQLLWFQYEDWLGKWFGPTQQDKSKLMADMMTLFSQYGSPLTNKQVRYLEKMYDHLVKTNHTNVKNNSVSMFRAQKPIKMDEDETEELTEEEKTAFEAELEAEVEPWEKAFFTPPAAEPEKPVMEKAPPAQKTTPITPVEPTKPAPKIETKPGVKIKQLTKDQKLNELVTQMFAKDPTTRQGQIEIGRLLITRVSAWASAMAKSKPATKEHKSMSQIAIDILDALKVYINDVDVDGNPVFPIPQSRKDAYKAIIDSDGILGYYNSRGA